MRFPFMSRSRQGRFRSALLLALTLVPTAAVAQQTITTATTGPIYGYGDSITLTTSGSIGGNGGVISTGTNTTTTLTNSGTITAYAYGLLNEATGSFTTITNAGFISGGKGLWTSGTIGTFENQAGGRLVGDSHGFLADGGGVGSLQNAGSLEGYNGIIFTGATLGTFTNSGSVGPSGGVGFSLQNAASAGTFTNSGVINGGSALDFAAGTSVLTLTNSGTIVGTNGIFSSATIGSMTNSVGGLINGSYRGMVQSGGAVGQFTNNGSVTAGLVGISFEGGATLDTFTNSGSIDVNGGTGVGLALTGTVTNLAGARIAGIGYGHGVAIADNVTLVTNAGEITAGLTALNIVSGTTTTINNSGAVSGSNRGLETGLNVTIGTFTNSGTFSGAYSVVVANTGTISNTATGLITATTNDALYLQGGKTLTLLDNAGSITGVQTGFNGNDGSTVGTLTNSGTISGGNAVVVATSGTVTNAAGGLFDGTAGDGVYVRGGVSSLAGLVNAGSITATSRGVNINAGTTNSIENSGSISGGYSGIESVVGAVIGTVQNTGTVSGGAYGAVLATTGTVTNAAGALIDGSASDGVYLHSGETLTLLENAGKITAGGSGVVGVAGSTIGTLTNSGTIQAAGNGLVLAASGTVTNLAGAAVSGAVGDAIVTTGSVQRIDNAGSLTGGDSGIHSAAGSIGSIGNTGSINGGGTAGITIGAATSVDSIDNSGTINGQLYGIYASYFSNNLGTLTNSGTISGEYYGAFLGTTGTVTNAAGGLIRSNTTAGYGIQADSATPIAIINAGTISGADAGVRMISSGTFTNQAGGVAEGGGSGFQSDGQVYLVDNAGLIRGDSAGVQVAFGSILSLVNTGTIGSTGASPKVAVSVGQYGTLGDASGTKGPAIVSTAAGALLDGGIVNAGRIAYGFRIGNQDVTVSAGTGPFGGFGVFDGGTLEVVNGSLTFTDGTLELGSDVSVNGGSGRFVNQATIELLANQTVTGNFEQTSAGTTLVDLLGLSPGNWGHLGITGTADFAGSLALDDSQLSGGINGGQTFELFSFASYTGGFSSLLMNGSALSSLGTGVWAYGGLTLTEIWTGTTMSLSVTGTAVPEIDPASFGSALALVLGSLGMLERKARRLVRRTS